MNKKISGTLRLFVACMFVISAVYRFNLYKPKNLTLYIILLIIIESIPVCYMCLNAIRDFSNKQIGFKFLYILFFIIKLFSIVAWRSIRERFSGLILIFVIINAIVGYFFIVFDFFQLWLKKPKHKTNSN